MQIARASETAVVSRPIRRRPRPRAPPRPGRGVTAAVRAMGPGTADRAGLASRALPRAPTAVKTAVAVSR